MDDDLLLRENPHLGHGLASWGWALTDVDFGRRWTPFLWCIAQICYGCGPVGFHLGTLLIGVALSVSVYFLFRQSMDEPVAFVLAAAFLASPLRLEIFAWSIGFVYSSTALACVWSAVFFLRGRLTLSLMFGLIGLLIYPVCAGFLLVLAFAMRKRWQGIAIAAVIAVVFIVQSILRVEIGFIPFAPTLHSAAWVFPHYLGSVFVPLATVPITPAGFYLLISIPLFFAVMWLAAWPRTFCLAFLISAPVVLASVTESFWFGARYSTLLGIFVLWLIGRRITEKLTHKSHALLWCVVGLMSLWTCNDYSFRSRRECIARAHSQCQFLYGHPVKFTVPQPD